MADEAFARRVRNSAHWYSLHLGTAARCFRGCAALTQWDGLLLTLLRRLCAILIGGLDNYQR